MAGTLDTIYGCSASAGLSDAQKLTNADNFAVRPFTIHPMLSCAAYRLFSFAVHGYADQEGLRVLNYLCVYSLYHYSK